MRRHQPVHLLAPEGYATRADLLAAGHTEHTVRAAAANGDIHRILPGLYAGSPRDQLDSDVLLRATLDYAGEDTYLTCISSLIAQNLVAPPVGDVHVGMSEQLRTHRVPGLVPHQFGKMPADALTEAGGLSVVRRDLAVVQSFGCLPLDAGRALVLTLTQERRIRPADVVEIVGPHTKRRRALLDVLELAAGGTHSPGEARMLIEALRQHGLPDPERQYRIELPSGVVYLDGAYPRPKVGLEYDGRAWHFDADRRNADLIRDAELAALGWLIIRCTDVQLRKAARWAALVLATVTARGGF